MIQASTEKREPTKAGAVGRAILLLTSVVVMGCAVQSVDPVQRQADETSLVQTTVTDPARSERLLALFDQRNRLIDESRNLLSRYRRETRAINADYDASRDVIVEMIDYYNRDRAQLLLRFIDLVTEMKRVTNADEWTAIAGYQQQIFNVRRLVYQSPAANAGMLNSMLNTLLIGCGLMGGKLLNPAEVESIGERVEFVIDDPDRVAAARGILDELTLEIEAYGRTFVDAGQEIGRIYRDHQTGSHPLRQTLERLNLEWYASQYRGIKLRDLLRETITAKEWTTVFDTT